MRSERSDLWLRKKLSLSQKERIAKSELEETSERFERTVKRAVIISLVTGGAFLIGYKIYKSLNSPKESPVEEKKKKLGESANSKSEPALMARTPFWQVLMERVALMAVQVIGTQLGVYLSRKLEEPEKKEED